MAPTCVKQGQRFPCTSVGVNRPWRIKAAAARWYWTVVLRFRAVFTQRLMPRSVYLLKSGHAALNVHTTWCTVQLQHLSASRSFYMDCWHWGWVVHLCFLLAQKMSWPTFAWFQTGISVQLRGRFERHLCGFMHECLLKLPPDDAKSSAETYFWGNCAASQSWRHTDLDGATVGNRLCFGVLNRVNVNVGLISWTGAKRPVYMRP